MNFILAFILHFDLALSFLSCSPKTWEIKGLDPGRVTPKTSPPSIRHIRESDDLNCLWMGRFSLLVQFRVHLSL